MIIRNSRCILKFLHWNFHVERRVGNNCGMNRRITRIMFLTTFDFGFFCLLACSRCCHTRQTSELLMFLKCKTNIMWTICRAISAWYDGREWFNTICKTVMEQDWSWNRPALDYLELYHAARKLE
jgi:hypothetical protein